MFSKDGLSRVLLYLIPITLFVSVPVATLPDMVLRERPYVGKSGMCVHSTGDRTRFYQHEVKYNLEYIFQRVKALNIFWLWYELSQQVFEFFVQNLGCFCDIKLSSPSGN